MVMYKPVFHTHGKHFGLDVNSSTSRGYWNLLPPSISHLNSLCRCLNWCLNIFILYPRKHLMWSTAHIQQGHQIQQSSTGYWNLLPPSISLGMALTLPKFNLVISKLYFYSPKSILVTYSMVTESDTGSIKGYQNMLPLSILHTMAVMLPKFTLMMSIHICSMPQKTFLVWCEQLNTYSRVTKSGKPATKIKYLPLFHTLQIWL